MRRLFIGVVLMGIGTLAIAEEDGYQRLNRPPRIDPDYAGVVIPPNIAPLNFRLRESFDQAVLEISAKDGPSFRLSDRKGVFRIPLKPWRRLLSRNAGQTLTFTIRIRKEGVWQVFQPIVNLIAEEPIDPYLAYRLINPAYSLWTEMGLYQRHLETFDERAILLNRLTDDNCMNCHHFNCGDPHIMLIHLRAGEGGGTLIRQNDQILKVNTATAFNKAGSYPAWHPRGDRIVFSANQLSMFFHAVGESRDVLDSASDLVLYLVDQNLITTDPRIASPEWMETFPCWAPDGQTLYFCSTRKLDDYVGLRDGREDLFWEKIQYDLMRISYDPETNTWGELSTVLTADQVGGSITLPRVSPDGNWVLLTVSAYSNFPIYLPSADLFLLHLPTGRFRRLECNSNQAESFHAWSQNGRWFVFSSKRQDGLLARPYFCYFTEDGRVSKPFILPQEDPSFYDTFLKTYNLPELVTGPIAVNPRTWARIAMTQRALQARLDPAIRPPAQETGEETLYQKAPR